MFPLTAPTPALRGVRFLLHLSLASYINHLPSSASSATEALPHSPCLECHDWAEAWEALQACHSHNSVNLFVRSSSLAWQLPEIRELKDEHFNGKEKDGFGVWEAVMKGAWVCVCVCVCMCVCVCVYQWVPGVGQREV